MKLREEVKQTIEPLEYEYADLVKLISKGDREIKVLQ